MFPDDIKIGLDAFDYPEVEEGEEDKEEDVEGSTRTCSECGGEGSIDLTVQAPRVVECKRCGGSGSVNVDS